MIVLDTSALVAILRGEPDADAFLARIVATDRCLFSSISLLETSMVCWLDVTRLQTPGPALIN